MKLFRINDMKAESFGPVFSSVTRATAMRDVTEQLLASPDMQRNAHDFAIYEVGESDAITGRITGQDPYHVCDVRELTANAAEDIDGKDTRARLAS